jgi:aryl-alcohol dehydrogenase-like predicted oxidoreductase
MQYSLLERSVEREHLPMTRALDLALTAWSPLGGGMLTGKYRRNSDPSNGDGRFGNSADSRAHFLTDRNFEIVEAAVEVDDRQLARLDDVSRVELGFPHDFIASVRRMSSIVGERAPLVDDHRAERSGV